MTSSTLSLSMVQLHLPYDVLGTEVGQEEQINAPGKMSFLAKFIELQLLMISHNSGLTKPHPYSSSPSSWPFMTRGISFWEDKDTLQQIYLLGNPLIWLSVIIGLLLYVALFIVDRLFLHRGINEFGNSVRKWWDRSVGFMFIAWVLHWFPFFLMGRMLFLHHYLPSFIFSAFVLALVLEFIGRVSNEQQVTTGHASGSTRDWLQSNGPVLYWIVLFALSCSYVAAFIYFSPLTYGTAVSSKDTLKSMQWLSGWDFQHLG